MDWGQALKVGGPASVAAYVFYELISTYILESYLVDKSLLVNVLLLVFIFIFCLFLAWLLVPKKGKGGGPRRKKVTDNEIEENSTDSDINIGKSADTIDGNKIKHNKSSGDINIG